MLLVIDFLTRFWTDLVGRADGPMSFRFFLQPTMALITAAIDGVRDARSGKPPYAWLMAHSAEPERRAKWREGVTATARILLLGVVMDVIYQWRVFGGFRYPVETIVIATLLAFVPYLIFRGPIARWQRRRLAKQGKAP